MHLVNCQILYSSYDKYVGKLITGKCMIAYDTIIYTIIFYASVNYVLCLCPLLTHISK